MGEYGHAPNAEPELIHAKGISLWLVPPHDTAAKLRRIMDMRTPTAKSPSSFPSFEPHITLCTVPSSSDIPALVSAIPSGQAVVPATFKSVEVGNKYFMSVYVTVHHESELNTLRAALTERLGESAIPPVAHVSLFYIDDADVDERTKIEKELRDEGRIIPLGEDRVAIDCSEGLSGSPHQS